MASIYFHFYPVNINAFAFIHACSALLCVRDLEFIFKKCANALNTRLVTETRRWRAGILDRGRRHGHNINILYLRYVLLLY